MATSDGSGWPTSKAFTLERSKREIKACTDVEKLQDLCIQLMLQVEATKEMILGMMIEQDSQQEE